MPSLLPRTSITAVFFAALIVAPLTSFAKAPVKDLGARTYVGEERGFKVLLEWDPTDVRRVALSTTRPGSVPVLMCVLEDEKVKSLPNKVSCEYDRGFALARTKDGYSLTIEKGIASEFSLGQEKPVPTVFKLNAVNPLELAAPGAVPYGVKRGGGNRSSESRHLPSPKAADIPNLAEVNTWVRMQGFEPAGIPMAAAERLWRRIDEASRDPFLNSLSENDRRDHFQKIVRSVLADL